MEKRDSSLQRTHLHCSRVQWQCALHHCIQRFALYLLMYCLDADARPWKLIPWSSLRTILELVIDSAESWRPLRTLRLSILWPRSIILRGLPLRGWVAVVPNCLYFVIIQLTVDCGIFRSEEISQLDLLHRWHPVTVPHWNSLSSWEWPILWQSVCLLLYTCGHGIDWTTWFQLFGWVSEYFWQHSVRFIL